jgi:hypothetical protein
MAIIINGSIVNSSFGNYSNVVISNGKVIIDGKDLTPESKEINIQITGDVQKIEIDNCNQLKINGKCNTVSSHNGNIEIEGDVLNSVSTHNGNVSCKNIAGSVSTKNGNIWH